MFEVITGVAIDVAFVVAVVARDVCLLSKTDLFFLSESFSADCFSS